MPKTNITDMTQPDWRAEVSWRPQEHVCRCGTTWTASVADCPKCGATEVPVVSGHVQVASVNQGSAFEFPPDLLDYGPNGEELRGQPEPFDGWRVTLDEAGINRMVTALLTARDAAFPPDRAAQLKGCRVCDNPDARMLCATGTKLTWEQWQDHAEHEYEDSREHGANKTNAWNYAVDETTKTYGPEPDKDEVS